jgi:serine/threonine-protein kinase
MDPATLTLFRDVVNRSSSEREDYYAQHQTSDQLRNEVEALVQAGERTIESFAGHFASAAVRALLEEPTAPTPAAPRAPLQPVSIGRYEVKRLLGRGGMSDVYLARDPMLERDIAVKLIGGDLDSEVARRRLVREASAVGRLRHPNIVTIFDAGEHDGQPYIAMEYVAGETFRSLIRRRAPLSLRRRLELIEGACAGLAHAHRSGVVHLDIKPDNLIVDEAGVVKVLDFGIARVLHNEALATRHVVGTLRYMSPEQIAGDPFDHRSDIFSLGSSLYELLTSLPAFAGSTREIVYQIAVGPIPRLAEVAPGTDPRLDAVVGRAMALEPGDRFADLDEFRAELARLRAELGPDGDQPVEMPDGSVAESRRAIRVPSTGIKAGHESRSAPATQGTPLRRSGRLAPRRRTAAALTAVAVVVLSVAGARWIWGEKAVPQAAPQAVAAPPVSVTPTVSSAPSEPARRDEAPPAAEGVVANEVWRRLALGDREQVLRLLKTGTANGGLRSTARLPYDVVAAVRIAVTQSRETANSAPGAASSDAFRLAEDRLASANRLEAQDPVRALTMLWEASDLYTKSANDSRTKSPAAAITPEPHAPSEPPVPAQTVLPPPTARAQPAPADSTPPAPAPDPPVTRGPDEQARPSSDVNEVLAALDRYRSAFEAREVSQVLTVYPSLSAAQVEQLRKTFAGMAAYELEIRDPRVQVQADVATARAMLVRRMTPRVGSAVSNQVETEFRLRRSAAGWVITDVIAR